MQIFPKYQEKIINWSRIFPLYFGKISIENSSKRCLVFFCQYFSTSLSLTKTGQMTFTFTKTGWRERMHNFHDFSFRKWRGRKEILCVRSHCCKKNTREVNQKRKWRKQKKTKWWWEERRERKKGLLKLNHLWFHPNYGAGRIIKPIFSGHIAFTLRQRTRALTYAKNAYAPRITR